MKILSDIAQEQDRKTIIFVETKRRADEIARTVNRRGFNALAIHGDKSQNERDYTLNSFRSGRMNVQILIATDVASRGLGEYFDSITFLSSLLSEQTKKKPFISQIFLRPRSLFYFRLDQIWKIYCFRSDRFFVYLQDFFTLKIVGKICLQ